MRKLDLLKTCIKCGIAKKANLTEFTADPRSRSGLRADCRECRRISDAARRNNKPYTPETSPHLKTTRVYKGLLKVPEATPAQDGPRIVTLDIETAPLESAHWGLWDQNIGLEQINVEWSILSFSAKWLDESKIIYMDTGGRGRNKVRDDSALLQTLWEILDEADIVVTQHGKSFDIKKINARFVMAGYKPYSPIKVIDTREASARLLWVHVEQATVVVEAPDGYS
jgi:hypothetical protein